MKTILNILTLILVTISARAQLDTTSYPKERLEIKQLLQSQKPGTLIDCDDFIAVGPKGDISFNREQWLEAQTKEKVIFKSVKPIAGQEIIRIYDGTLAVVNVLIQVKLAIEAKDVDIKVRRLEIFHKKQNKWCRVAGQGTQVDERLFPVSSTDKGQ